jgi:hypothetical protein
MPLRSPTPSPRFALATLFLCALATRADAQSLPASDSLPLRRGQWGVEGTLPYSAAGGGGVLRMLSSRTALALHVTGGVSGSDRGASDGTSVGVQPAIGVRRWRPIAPAFAGFVEAGGLFSFRRSTSEQQIAERREEESTRELGAGVYLQLGASYFVAPA